jgi:hypothetical protein
MISFQIAVAVVPAPPTVSEQYGKTPFPPLLTDLTVYVCVVVVPGKSSHGLVTRILRGAAVVALSLVVWTNGPTRVLPRNIAAPIVVTAAPFSAVPQNENSTAFIADDNVNEVVRLVAANEVPGVVFVAVNTCMTFPVGVPGFGMPGP